MIHKILSVLGVLALLLSAFTLIHSTARAVNVSNNPFVVTVIDQTNQGSTPCILTHVDNVGTSHEVTTRTQCPVGTIMGTSTLLRSQALSHHESYVLLSDMLASGARHQQALQQLDRMRLTKISSISQASSATRTLPLTQCDNQRSNYADSHDDYGYTSIHSTVVFYVLPGTLCTRVTLESSSMQVKGVGSTPVQILWEHDQYQGGYFNVPGTPNIVHGGSFSHGVNQVEDKGYTYENWIYNNYSGKYTWCDMRVS